MTSHMIWKIFTYIEYILNSHNFSISSRANCDFIIIVFLKWCFRWKLSLNSIYTSIFHDMKMIWKIFFMYSTRTHSIYVELMLIFLRWKWFKRFFLCIQHAHIQYMLNWCWFFCDRDLQYWTQIKCIWSIFCLIIMHMIYIKCKINYHVLCFFHRMQFFVFCDYTFDIYCVHNQISYFS